MPDYTLYSYFRSSCSARLRIVLNLKDISYDTAPVNLLDGEQLSESHRALNPSATSVAALEFLEEVHPETPILPPAGDAKARAVVRTLVNIVSADMQPVTNLRIMRRVRALGGNAEEWNKELMTDGLRAYEAVAKDHAGKYSFGDAITMADACLLPAAWNAERFGVDLRAFPVVSRVVDSLNQHPAVVKAHYFNQPDTPENLRTKT
ncbi:putative glutathione S-transferase [Hirsutella rhossiliensis]|uniref:Glutathione S-transferase n=1 Tax=Hirsutella rhossiliensis TaxID=111463 RepID=A0A9P8SNA3_9HYPO|nr:putative glutathione S-transferase [Hirsutella rhossiliensis]KAH0967670.1 putative glutathione S-transferase [Hirsutella rhossiliensis]